MEHEILKLVGERIRDIRKSKGLSQEALGEKAGFSYSYLGSIERGKKNISLINLAKISKALEIEVYQLFAFARQYEEVTTTESELKKAVSLLSKRPTEDIQTINKIMLEIFARIDRK